LGSGGGAIDAFAAAIVTEGEIDGRMDVRIIPSAAVIAAGTGRPFIVRNTIATIVTITVNHGRIRYGFIYTPFALIAT
jgi:hypothetical protein